MPDKRLIAIPSLIVAGGAVWFMMMFAPAQSERKALGVRLAGLEQEIGRQIPEAQLDAMSMLIDSLASLADKRARRIYPEERMLDLGRALEGVGKRYGLALTSVAPDYDHLSVYSENREEITELPMIVEFAGSFMQMARFLDDIPKLEFALRFQEVSLSKSDEKSTKLDILLRGVIIMRKARDRTHDITT